MIPVYIPTYRRIEEQRTWDILPPTIRRYACLVVPADEVEAHQQRGRRVIPCPVQGCIAATREWIVRRARSLGHQHVGMMDDDIRTFVYSQPFVAGSRSINDPFAMDDWLKAVQWVQTTLTTTPACGFKTTLAPSLLLDTDIPARMTCAFFLNTETLPIDQLDWCSVDYGEDLFLTLQLIRMGVANVMSNRFRFIPPRTGGCGGCTAQGRNSDEHNRSMQYLIDQFHPFVVQSGKQRQGHEDWIKIRVAWKKMARFYGAI